MGAAPRRIRPVPEVLTQVTLRKLLLGSGVLSSLVYLAAIDVLARCAPPTVLVLGDMGEVGEQAAEFHREVGAYARSRNVSSLCAFGAQTGEAVAAFGAAGSHAGSIEQLLERVHASATPQATLLIKGSRFMRMERVVNALTGEMGGAH